MVATDLLPYITVLGTVFVLIGFVVLIWKEAVWNSVSTIAFFCFVTGIALMVGSLYMQQNLTPDSIPIPTHHVAPRR